jgi:hypothetical protein
MIRVESAGISMNQVHWFFGGDRRAQLVVGGDLRRECLKMGAMCVALPHSPPDGALRLLLIVADTHADA